MAAKKTTSKKQNVMTKGKELTVIKTVTTKIKVMGKAQTKLSSSQTSKRPAIKASNKKPRPAIKGKSSKNKSTANKRVSVKSPKKVNKISYFEMFGMEMK